MNSFRIWRANRRGTRRIAGLENFHRQYARFVGAQRMTLWKG